MSSPEQDQLVQKQLMAERSELLRAESESAGLDSVKVSLK